MLKYTTLTLSQKKGVKSTSLCLILPVILAAGGSIAQYLLTRRDRKRCQALGMQVSVPGARMHIYAQGRGPSLVLLSGWSTAVPSVDYQPLIHALLPFYRVIVIEKPGYGFSSDTRVPRVLPTIVDELRAALKAAGETGPYLLCGHSMAGCEVVYWSCRYPDEVRGAVMLDAPAPPCYETLPLFPSVLWHSFALVRFIGLRRLFLHFPPFVHRYQSHLNGYRYLDPSLLPVERAMQASRYLSRPMREEMRRLRENCRTAGGKLPEGLKLLMFVASNTKTRWKLLQPEEDAFIARNNAMVVELTGKHNLQHYAPSEIALHIHNFYDKEGAS